jgi:hypothetical protein
MERTMLKEPQLFEKIFSGNIELSTEAYVSICRRLAVMERIDPDSLTFHDSRVNKMLYDEARQLAKDCYSNSIILALSLMWNKFKSTGETQNANITYDLLQNAIELEKIEAGEEEEQRDEKQITIDHEDYY